MSQETVKKALLETIAGIEGDARKAKVVFRATSTLEENVRCSARIRDFPPMVIDEPPELGGKDAGANPVELVLAALGTCQEIMFSAYASVMDIKLEGVQVTARGYLDLRGLLGIDPNIPAGYQRIVYDVDIKSPASDDAIRKLVETVEAHCPVMDILSRPMQVEGKAKLNGRLLSQPEANAA